MASTALAQHSYESIKKGSLSFSFASQLLPRRIRDRVVKLYAWCRYVDNQVDGLSPEASQQERQRVLSRLESDSFSPRPRSHLPEAMQAFRAVRREVQFPIPYARDLIRGMAMDLQGQKYETETDLYLYCYRVAGVVGLMMSHLMDVSSQRASQHAMDLGIAMQLTNICRDVGEDARMGRVYLPSRWLCEAGYTGDDIMALDQRPQLLAVVNRALDLADGYYRSGDVGLKFLPFRCALAIAVAREVYAAIGHEVRRRGASAWDQRVWIPLPRKVSLALKGITLVLKTIPYRFHKFSQKFKQASAT